MKNKPVNKPIGYKTKDKLLIKELNNQIKDLKKEIKVLKEEMKKTKKELQEYDDYWNSISDEFYTNRLLLQEYKKRFGVLK